MIFYRIVEDTMINIVQLSDFKFSMNAGGEFILISPIFSPLKRADLRFITGKVLKNFY